MRHPRRPTILHVGLIALMALAAAGGYGWWRLDHADSRTGTGPLVLYGNVEIRQADLAFGVEGPIAQVLVDEGDRVEAGQTLAVLEQDAFVHAEANTEAMLRSAEAQLGGLLFGSRPQEIERVRANVSAAEAALDNAELNLRRSEEVAKHEHAAQQALDSARLTQRIWTRLSFFDSGSDKLRSAVCANQLEMPGRAHGRMQAPKAMNAIWSPAATLVMPPSSSWTDIVQDSPGYRPTAHQRCLRGLEHRTTRARSARA